MCLPYDHNILLLLVINRLFLYYHPIYIYNLLYKIPTIAYKVLLCNLFRSFHHLLYCISTLLLIHSKIHLFYSIDSHKSKKIFFNILINIWASHYIYILYTFLPRFSLIFSFSLGTSYTPYNFAYFHNTCILLHVPETFLHLLCIFSNVF